MVSSAKYTANAKSWVYDTAIRRAIPALPAPVDYNNKELFENAPPYMIKERSEEEKYRIRETLNLLTDAASRTDAKFAQKKLFCATILDYFQAKMFKSETTCFHYFH